MRAIVCFFCLCACVSCIYLFLFHLTNIDLANGGHRHCSQHVNTRQKISIKTRQNVRLRRDEYSVQYVLNQRNFGYTWSKASSANTKYSESSIACRVFCPWFTFSVFYTQVFAYLDKWCKTHRFDGTEAGVEPIFLIFVIDGKIDPLKISRNAAHDLKRSQFLKLREKLLSEENPDRDDIQK